MRHDELVPDGARPAARVVVISDGGNVLLLHAQDSLGHRWWLAPGGGLDAGETFEEAARRELREETGRDLAIGPLIWTRRHIYNWNGRPQDQYECYFVVRCREEFVVTPAVPDTYVIGHRWWALREIQQSPQAPWSDPPNETREAAGGFRQPLMLARLYSKTSVELAWPAAYPISVKWPPTLR